MLKCKKLHNMSSYGIEMLPQRPISPIAAKVEAEVPGSVILAGDRAQEPQFSVSVEMGTSW